jgi:hypothetical protein
MNRTQNKKLSAEQHAATEQAKRDAAARNSAEHTFAQDQLVNVRKYDHAKDNPAALAHLEQAPQEVK